MRFAWLTYIECVYGHSMTTQAVFMTAVKSYLQFYLQDSRDSFLRIAEKRLLTESKLMALAAVHVVQLFYNNNFKVILTNPPVSLSFKQSSSWTLYSSKGSEGGVRQNVISKISILWLNDSFVFLKYFLQSSKSDFKLLQAAYNKILQSSHLVSLYT